MLSQAAGQALGVANTYSNGFAVARFPPDGLLGMSFPPLSDFNKPPVIQTMISQGQLNAPQFSFKFASAGGELYVGGVNNALFRGAFAYASVTNAVRLTLTS